MEPHDFGKKVKERREALGLSQNDLAMALRIDQGKVSLIEKGARKVDVVKELPALARVLQCPIGWFYGEAGNTIPAHALVKQFFPDVEFNDVDLKRVEKFLEPIVKSYIEADLSMGAAVEEHKKAMGE